VTTGMVIVPKDWREFQHYKDRSPPWIRLHKKLLDNYEFHCLPVASRALAPMLWLLASDSVHGEIDATPEKLAFRLRMTKAELTEALTPLIDNGFFEVSNRASKSLAERKQSAVPETETETEAETEAETELTGGASPAEPAPPKNSSITFRKWIEHIKAAGEKPIPEDDPIFEYAKDANIPDEYLRVTWQEFKSRYIPADKRYKDWRHVFRNCVREDWFKLWRFDGGGACVLTSKGMQAMNALMAKEGGSSESA
jgi:hypothetical protein